MVYPNLDFQSQYPVRHFAWVTDLAWLHVVHIDKLISTSCPHLFNQYQDVDRSSFCQVARFRQLSRTSDRNERQVYGRLYVRVGGLIVVIRDIRVDELLRSRTFDTWVVQSSIYIRIDIGLEGRRKTLRRGLWIGRRPRTVLYMGRWNEGHGRCTSQKKGSIQIEDEMKEKFEWIHCKWTSRICRRDRN